MGPIAAVGTGSPVSPTLRQCCCTWTQHTPPTRHTHSTHLSPRCTLLRFLGSFLTAQALLDEFPVLGPQPLSPTPQLPLLFTPVLGPFPRDVLTSPGDTPLGRAWYTGRVGCGGAQDPFLLYLGSCVWFSIIPEALVCLVLGGPVRRHPTRAPLRYAGQAASAELSVVPRAAGGRVIPGLPWPVSSVDRAPSPPRFTLLLSSPEEASGHHHDL